MKKNVIRVLFIVLTLCWMGFIFYMSSQNGSESSNLSGKITKFFIRLFVHDYDTLSLEQQNRIYRDASYYIRKSAHYSEYSILALFLFFSVYLFIKNQAITFGISSLISIAYAMTDEFHQSFVSGRAMTFTDVLIDSLGTITMLLFILTIFNLITIKKYRKKS